jgi:predicted Rossmann fold nucleotide-binding protein DprA/Smf involved in DNA uptake
MQHSEAVAKQIESRITELKSEIKAHERALAALRGQQARRSDNAATAIGRPATAGRERGASAKRRTRRRRATTSAEAVFDALKGGEDQAAAIAKQFGVSTAVVRNRLQQLEEAGRVSRTGNRRSTRWRSHAG